jgi:acyl-coenzyme A thioesterase PaaI-like protein
MDVTQIPFAKHIGIERKEEGTLKLEPTDMVQNHIQTIHASAQFALAETQSGLFLQEAFPELVGKVAGLLRGATVKQKKPATKSIYAVAMIEEEMKEKFIKQLERKKRATITVHTTIKDIDDMVVMAGEFMWYIEILP